MARKSIQALAIVSTLEKHRPRIKTPPGLCEAERELFKMLVNTSTPSHFTESDTPLLVAYVQAILLSQAAFDAACDDPAELPTWA